MSLNGLDDAQVKEAHEAAVAEAGGWFLLKYASRDEIELLGRGTGGIVEIRNGIAQYEEKSPLYGLLRYRRRNVIIKYLPEGCSRLVQARVTVHFDAICDRFSPYDTTFSITDAKELKDTKLSAACSLHAASGSTSSSTSSLRRRRLMEIAEEEEEEERERKRQSVVNEEDRPRSAESQQGPSALQPPLTLNADLATSPEASRFVEGSEPPRFTGVPRPASPAKSFDDSARRMSTQSARSDLYPTSSYHHTRPRVKLGPRPSADLSGRPRTSAGSATYRPVSSIPAGLKLSKGSRRGRTNDLDEEGPESPIKEEMEAPLVSAPPAGPENKPADSSPVRPQTSSGTSEAAVLAPPKFNIPSSAASSSKQPTITPEKARLLKAMKLREKKKMMSLQPPLPGADIPSAPSTPGLPEDHTGSETPEDIVPVETGTVESEAPPNEFLIASKSDSGVEMDVAADHVSVDTHSDSHPTSPFASSDIGESTKASSLSESTDETVHAKDEYRLSENGDAEDGPGEDVEPVQASGSGVYDDQVDQRISAIPEARAEAHDLAKSRESEDQELAATHVIELIQKPVSEPASESVENAPGQSADAQEPSPAEQEPVFLPKTEVLSTTPSPETLHVKTDAESTLAETAPENLTISSSAQEPTPEEEPVPQSPSSPKVRVPLSKFSTQESKSPVSAATSPVVPAIVPQASDAEQIRAAAVPPPVPEKDNKHEANDGLGDTTQEAKSLGRKAGPGPIRTDLETFEDKRRSVASILDNDGLMDELQSATVQEATPITVSKSPITPFFPSEAGSKKAPGAADSPSIASRFSRTVSNPVRGSLLSPADGPPGSVRSVSTGAAFLNKITQQQQAAELRPKTGKIGSSISQRIKALQELSSTTGAPEPAPKERPATTFFSVRKAGGRELSRSPSVADRASSLTRGTTPSPPDSRESSPEHSRVPRRDRSGSIGNRLSMFEGGMAPRGRPESIQVTARIVRDPTQPFPKVPDNRTDTTDYGPLELRHSPLVVDLQRRVSSQSPVRPSSIISRASEQAVSPEKKPSLLERRLSKDRRSASEDHQTEAAEDAKSATEGPRPRRRSSLTVVKDFIKDKRESLLGGGARSPSTDNLSIALAPSSMASPALTTSSRSPSRPPSVHHNVSFPRRLSIGSRRSSMEQSSPVSSSITLAVTSPPRAVELESETDGKSSSSGDKKGGSGSNPTSPNQGKGNRATRFMRRLSNSLGSSRKNVTPSISPTVAEEDAAEVEAASRSGTAHGQPSIVAYMGDVNVQFPDNLLWKRRSLCLDNQGFLILSAVSGTAVVPTMATGKDRQQAGAIKRYHMSDFKPPYTPDVELQELPNSVVLDFVDGSGLQIACEDRAGQMNILHILEEAHETHTSFGQ